MQKSLVLKELRESAGLVAVGALAAVCAYTDLIGVRLVSLQNGTPSTFPFVRDEPLSLYLILLSAGLALVLGFKQSAWELWQGSYYFLLHRPVSRRTIFGIKLALGVAVTLLVPGLLILAFALWAATPGKHPSPFFWSMTAWAWQWWAVFPLIYLGAFLSGIRPGRWFGTRLVPLAAASVMALAAAIAPWWWLTLVVVLLSSAALVTAIFYYAETRDY